jgi:hypothetical protein
MIQQVMLAPRLKPGVEMPPLIARHQHRQRGESITDQREAAHKLPEHRNLALSLAALNMSQVLHDTECFAS